MAFKDGSKAHAFQMWINGKTLQEIILRSTAEETTVRGWVLDWERGRQQDWIPNR